MYGPTTQCNSKTYYQNLSCLPMSLTYVLSLNCQGSTITGWAVALTCCISHSANYRKNADFDPPREQKPLNQVWRNLAWLTTFRTPSHMTTLVGAALRGWSGQICDLSNLRVFFLSFFAFFSARPGRISWPIGTIYTPKRAFPAKDVPFGGRDDIRQHLGVNPPPQKNLPKMGGNRHFTAKSAK